jgi:hypothetical protein
MSVVVTVVLALLLAALPTAALAQPAAAGNQMAASAPRFATYTAYALKSNFDKYHEHGTWGLFQIPTGHWGLQGTATVYYVVPSPYGYVYYGSYQTATGPCGSVGYNEGLLEGLRAPKGYVLVKMCISTSSLWNVTALGSGYTTGAGSWKLTYQK